MSPFVNSLLKGTIDDAVRTTALLNDDELAEVVHSLDGSELAALRDWTLGKLSNHHIDSVLKIGCLLHLLRSLSDKGDQRSILLSVANELEISETKAYDAIAVFRAFGRALTNHPEWAPAFSVEALKRLSTKSATEADRNTALREAERGGRVTAQRAEEILQARRPAPATEPTPATARHTPPPEAGAGDDIESTDTSDNAADGDAELGLVGPEGDQPVLSYRGEAVVVTLTPIDPDALSVPDRIANDIRAALDTFIQHHLDATNPDAA